jgi:hypothetical protein
MCQSRLDHPHVQTTVLKRIGVKCTSSCIIFKIGSSTFSNFPLHVFEMIDNMCVTDINSLCCIAIHTFYLSMFLELF